MKPTIILLAGPNGAGKSTLYETRVAPSFAGSFINADIIQREDLRDTSPEASYEAARIASIRRAEYLAKRRDFVTETVFSHPSKLEFVDEARTAGFTVIIMHVGVDSSEVSVPGSSKVDIAYRRRRYVLALTAELLLSGRPSSKPTAAWSSTIPGSTSRQGIA